MKKSKPKKIRIDVAPITTLGGLLELVQLATTVVDWQLTHQNQAETPIKLDFTIGGKINAITVIEARDLHEAPVAVGAGDDIGHEDPDASITGLTWTVAYDKSVRPPANVDVQCGGCQHPFHGDEPCTSCWPLECGLKGDHNG